MYCDGVFGDPLIPAAQASVDGYDNLIIANKV